MIQVESIFDRDEILQSLWSGYQTQGKADTESDILSNWIKTKIQEALRNVKVATERDSGVLMAFGERFGMEMFVKE